MDKILSSLLIAAAVSSLVIFAEDTPRNTMEDGKRRVEFTLHGKTSCALVDDKIFCVPATTRTPIRLASSISN
jgi:hypothetical protein